MISELNVFLSFWQCLLLILRLSKTRPNILAYFRSFNTLLCLKLHFQLLLLRRRQRGLRYCLRSNRTLKWVFLNIYRQTVDEACLQGQTNIHIPNKLPKLKQFLLAQSVGLANSPHISMFINLFHIHASTYPYNIYCYSKCKTNSGIWVRDFPRRINCTTAMLQIPKAPDIVSIGAIGVFPLYFSQKTNSLNSISCLLGSFTFCLHSSVRT